MVFDPLAIGTYPSRGFRLFAANAALAAWTSLGGVHALSSGVAAHP